MLPSRSTRGLSTRRYVCEAVDLDETACPDELLSPELTLSGTVAASSGIGPYAAVVYYDPPLQPLSADELRTSFSGPYDDSSPERTCVVWPWDFSFDSGDGTFSASFKVCGDMALRPGSYYVQLLVTTNFGELPYGRGPQDGYEIPGDDASTFRRADVSKKTRSPF